MKRPINEEVQKGHSKINYLSQQIRRYITTCSLSSLHISHYLFIHVYISLSFLALYYSIPFISLCRTFFFSFLFSFSSSSVSAPFSVVPSPNSIFFVQFSIFGPFSLFSFLFFFIYFFPFRLCLVHALLFCVCIYSHSAVSFSLLNLISSFPCLVMQQFQQTCKDGSNHVVMPPFVRSQLTTSHISNCFYSACTNFRSRPPGTTNNSTSSFKLPNCLT